MGIRSERRRLSKARRKRHREIKKAQRLEARAKRLANKERQRALRQKAERAYKRARGLAWKIRHLRKRIKQQQKRHEAPEVAHFEPWMLNGCPGNIHPSVKVEVVRAIRHGLVITATTNGTHVPDSNHYPWNFSDHLGHALDAAGSLNKMRAFTADSFENAQHYREFFGPPNTRFVKWGQIHPGSIPNHYNHNHDSPTF